MRVEVINPFLETAFFVLVQYTNSKPTRGNLSLVPSPVKGHDVNIVVGVTGDILGQLIFSMRAVTAKKIASIMLEGQSVSKLDEISKSALCELGNIITGNAAIELSNHGFNCRVTPPTLVMGEEMTISCKDVQILKVPIKIDLGALMIYIAVRETDKLKNN